MQHKLATPPKGISVFTGPDAPKEEDLYKCIHCGLCLNVCPTYLETGLETESPRGRISLMKAAYEGRIGLTGNVLNHWNLCLQCRACEVACPSGVPFGRLMEGTRAEVVQKRRGALLPRLAWRLAFHHLLPHQRRLELLVSALRLYQRGGIQKLIRGSRILHILPFDLAELEATLPKVPAFFQAKGQIVPAQGERRARVGLLSGCVMPLVHGPTMEAVVRVLSRNGCEVVVPSGQLCCGALNAHAGERQMARRMARNNVDAFFSAKVDAIIVASAGCGSTMKEYGELLGDDSEYTEKADRFGHMVKDVHEFLAELPLIPPEAELSYKVTYQDACHLTHAQRVTAAPRKVLQSIPALELIEMVDSSRCCGAAGSYSITQREMSLRVLDTKMQDVEATGAYVVATANPGCTLQLQAGSRRAGLSLQIRYVIDLLDEAYQLEEKVGRSSSQQRLSQV